MNLHYSILFTLDLLHEYFANGRSDDFDLIPAKDTTLLLGGIHVLWKKSGGRFFALIKSTAKGGNVYTPFINVPPAEQYRTLYSQRVFRFYLVLRNATFINYTNLDQEAAAGKKYYFSNTVQNNRNGALYLSMPVTDHVNGKEYSPGDLVMEPATDNVFEAITRHTSTNVSQLTDAALWAPKGLRFLARPLKNFTIGTTYQQGEWVLESGINVFEAVKTHTATSVAELSDPLLWKGRGEGQLQYPTENDLVAYSSGSYLFTPAAPVTDADITFFRFNYDAAAPAFDVPVGEHLTQTFESPQAQVAIDLSSLPPGKYVIDLNGETKTVYYDPMLAMGNVFGIIEIFNHLPGTDAYSFLTDDEDIRKVHYVIHFSSRRVLWKYTRKDGTAQSITDTGTTGYGFTMQGDDFVSDVPILLSQEALDTLELDFNNSNFKLFPLPNPPVHRLGRFTQNGYAYLCSELFLNY